MNKMATVVGFFDSGGAKVQMDGEENPSEKEYPYLNSYIPKMDDRVFLLEFGESYIILGCTNFETAPADSENITIPGNIKSKNIQAENGTIGTLNVTTIENEKINEISKNVSENTTKIKETQTKIDTDIKDVKESVSGAKKQASSNSNSISNLSKKINSQGNEIQNVGKNVQKSIGRAVETNYLKVFNQAGFFGSSPTGKHRVSNYIGSGQNDVRNKLVELINALSSYGLV